MPGIGVNEIIVCVIIYEPTAGGRRPADDTSRPATPSVVVGFDDSAGSYTAPQVATDEAAARGTRLVAVHVCLGGLSGWDIPQHVHTAIADLQADRARAGESRVQVDVRLAEGDPVDQLRLAATGAALLVLGEPSSRAANDVLASVSKSWLDDAPCPLLIVPAIE